MFGSGVKLQSLEARMASVGGPTRGFDYLRIVLALGVVYWHAVLVSYGVDATIAAREIVWARPLHNAILPMFFALSGFLVTGSLLRVSLPQFVALRALRILPALSVEVTISAIILGAVFTTLPLGTYFTSSQFAGYFLNIVGEIHYTLPGVFQANPFPDNVNTQLWTIPFELACYLALLVLSLFRVIKLRWAFLLGLIAGTAGTIGYDALMHPVSDGHDGRLLVMSFLAGVVVYLFRDKLAFDWRLALVSALVSVILLTVHSTIYLSALPLAYLTAYLGLTHPPKSFLTAGGDYSYGIYLFSVPIQQAVAQYAWAREWWINLAIALPISIFFAVLSWHLVEKRALNQKKRVLKAVARAEQHIAGMFPSPKRPMTSQQPAE
jgi:peptidoglycan/LPS O-acetylase OafA/YrhL